MPNLLYLLVRKDKNSFKIGITDNLESRHDRLRMVWGDFDLASSYTVSGSSEEIVGLERILHYLLKKWRIDHVIKLEGYSEWFSMECFEKALEIISLISQIKEVPFDKRLKKTIALTIKNSKQNKKVAYPSRAIDLTDLKNYWPSYEKATLGFKDNPVSNEWVWTIDLRHCQVSPYELLAFQSKNGWIAFASSYTRSIHENHIINISLSKLELHEMGQREEFKEVYEFLSDMITRLELLQPVGVCNPVRSV